MEELKINTISRITKKEFFWEMARDALERNDVQYQIGDVVTSELRNSYMQWVITDLGSDYIRFEARNCITSRDLKMNRERTNAGGIASSLMQEYLNNDIWNLLPDDLQDVISTVNRKYMDGNEEKTYQTKLFLPSASEVFNEDNCLGEKNLYKQLDYYKDCLHRIKRGGFLGGSAHWWLSSPLFDSTTCFCSVTTVGAADYNVADNYLGLGVAPCFMITKS